MMPCAVLSYIIRAVPDYNELTDIVLSVLLIFLVSIGTPNDLRCIV